MKIIVVLCFYLLIFTDKGYYKNRAKRIEQFVLIPMVLLSLALALGAEIPSPSDMIRRFFEAIPIMSGGDI